ncbi:MAG: aryl-sulfate sulfotransferase [Bacilli bacterium]
MKTKYKIVFLIFTACLFSIAIYYLSEKAQPVSYVNDIIKTQNTIDKTELKDTNYTIDDPKIILDPYGISPLTALVIFETKDLTTPSISVIGDTKETTFNFTFKPGKVHYLPIYGLYPDRENKVMLSVNGNLKELTIKTNPLPKDFKKATSVSANKSKLDGNELYFVTPSSLGYTSAFDINGDVRWYLNDFFIWDINRLNNGNLMLSTNRLINPPYYMTGLIEMDLLGKIYYEYSIPGGYHHDYFELEDGNLIVASNNFENGTVEDYIVEIDRETGKVVKNIDLTKILPKGQGKNENYTNDYDWFHNNSVWFDSKTDSLTVSGRHMDAVVNIDYESLEINWIVGDKTNWDKKYHKYFFNPTNENFIWQYAQHAAMILPNGNLFLFDNGNNKSKIKKNNLPAKDNYSRGVIYKLNTSNMTITEVYQFGKELGSDFYSPYISDVDYIGENHYLIHSGGISYKDNMINNQPAGLTKNDKKLSTTVEVKDGNQIFKLNLPTNTYRVEKMALYSNSTYQPKEGIKLGNLGVTKTDKNKNLLLFNKNGKKVVDKYNLKFKKESDRLVVSGKFKKSDEVTIILDNVFRNKTYNLVISKKPYTAMCVDVFNKEEEKNGINVTKYINDEGLSGKYYIYMDINGTVYDFDKYIEF